MVATVPIQTAHRVAAQYERMTWGRAYSDIWDANKCVRISRREVSCRYVLQTEVCTSSTDCTFVNWDYDVHVKRHANTYLVWED